MLRNTKTTKRLVILNLPGTTSEEIRWKDNPGNEYKLAKYACCKTSQGNVKYLDVAKELGLWSIMLLVKTVT